MKFHAFGSPSTKVGAFGLHLSHKKNHTNNVINLAKELYHEFFSIWLHIFWATHESFFFAGSMKVDIVAK
jgi:hypothetical protein